MLFGLQDYFQFVDCRTYYIKLELKLKNYFQLFDCQTYYIQFHLEYELSSVPYAVRLPQGNHEQRMRYDFPKLIAQLNVQRMV